MLVFIDNIMMVLRYVEICEGIQARNNARKLGQQPDEPLAVNQTYTHRHTNVYCDRTVCFYAR